MRSLILVSLYSSPPINIRIYPIFRMAQYPASTYMASLHLVQSWSESAAKRMSTHWSLGTSDLRLLSLCSHSFLLPPHLLTAPPCSPSLALTTRRPELFRSLAVS